MNMVFYPIDKIQVITFVFSNFTKLIVKLEFKGRNNKRLPFFCCPNEVYPYRMVRLCHFKIIFSVLSRKVREINNDQNYGFISLIAS